MEILLDWTQQGQKWTGQRHEVHARLLGLTALLGVKECSCSLETQGRAWGQRAKMCASYLQMEKCITYICKERQQVTKQREQTVTF